MSEQVNELELVKEFHTVFDHPINEEPTFNRQITANRIGYMMEELREFAVATGSNTVMLAFLDAVAKETKEIAMALEATDRKPNQVEMLDALCDLEYFLKGTILTEGFTNIYPEAFKLVHESNMTKCASTDEEEQETLNKLVGYPNYRCSDRFVGDKKFTVFYDGLTNKVLKASCFKPVDLKPLFNEK